MGSILLSAAEQRILHRAVSILDRESFVAKLTELTGEPVTRIMKMLPRVASNRDPSGSTIGSEPRAHSCPKRAGAGSAFEPLGSAQSFKRTLWCSKTGTLTSRVPHIHDLIRYNERHLSARKLLGLASAESRLQHVGRRIPWQHGHRPRSEKTYSRRLRAPSLR
jgi:hypothetical protein